MAASVAVETSSASRSAECKNDRALVARQQDELDAQPQRRRVALKRQLNRLAGQGLGPFLEQPAAARLLCCAEACAVPVGLPAGSFSKGPRTGAGRIRENASLLGVSLDPRLLPLNAMSWPCRAILRNCFFLFNIHKRRAFSAR
jgi:hypothetical protein